MPLDATAPRSRTVSTNGVNLHVELLGEGPLVLLLHGFPESALTWSHVMRPLADAGFTVAAPDLRGYGRSDKPKGVAAYDTSVIVEDIAGLVRGLGFESAHVVAHDWGGAAAWELAQPPPFGRADVVDKLVIVNAPHPAVFARRLRTPEQLLASWYVFAFQLPVLPERLIARHDFAALERLLRHQPRRPGAYTDDEIRAAKQMLAAPGALTGALHWYRAAARRQVRRWLRRERPATGGAHTIECPVLVVWGLEDAALPAGNLDGLERYVRDLRVVRLPGVSHWVPHDAPEDLVRETLAFLKP